MAESTAARHGEVSEQFALDAQTAKGTRSECASDTARHRRRGDRIIGSLLCCMCLLLAHCASWPIVRNWSEAGMDGEGERRE
jgi:ferric-dicitrate binding protein FerR (iron transport regulator)